MRAPSLIAALTLCTACSELVDVDRSDITGAHMDAALMPPGTEDEDGGRIMFIPPVTGRMDGSVRRSDASTADAGATAADAATTDAALLDAGLTSL